MLDIEKEQQEREALVAEWLLATPGFFERHANLLAEIQLKNPHGDRAISLQERQLSVLREQNQVLNKRLSDMLRFGSQNDKTQELMIDWLKNLLLANNEANVLVAITSGLNKIFGVEVVSVLNDSTFNVFCGSRDAAEDSLKELIGTAQSLALINMPGTGSQLLLASEAADKFTADMGRVYLEQIGELAAAAIVRARG
jgi:uncharacterized protein YigA (DUF484 family)